MQEILRLQKKIVPELVEVLEKRYNVLRTIYYNQPIGRRILANQLNLGERIVRTEINFLKSQGLIEINTPGMTVTSSGEEIVNNLKDFIHEIKGLSDIENQIKSLLHLRKVIIVPGDVEENPTILKDLGKACAAYVKDIIHDNCIIALTGGSTINVIIIPIKSVPNSGNNNTGFIPSKDCGSLLNNFLSPTTKYPAKKPAIKAPKNPAPPSFAIAPPTNPTTRAGLSAIE